MLCNFSVSKWKNLIKLEQKVTNLRKVNAKSLLFREKREKHAHTLDFVEKPSTRKKIRSF